MSANTLAVSFDRCSPLPNSRLGRIASAVVLVHLALIWVAEQGLLQRPAQLEAAQVIMASVVVQAQAAPAPQARAQPAAGFQPPARPHQRVVAPSPVPALQAALTQAPDSPAANSSPTGTSPSATPSVTTVNSAMLPQTGVAPTAELVLPSADADYLNNPPPAYPRQSKRMGEQGTVVVRVLIGLQGTAEKADIDTSSGFARLDHAALVTVQRWRYVPGKRMGAPEAMWFKVPVRFILE